MGLEAVVLISRPRSVLLALGSEDGSEGGRVDRGRGLVVRSLLLTSSLTDLTQKMAEL